jgi:hypothetical protein
VIRGVTWFCAEHYGVSVPGQRSWEKPSPALSAQAEILALIDRPVKHYGRMTAESRFCLCAASLALRAMSASESGDQEVGLISASFDGCLEANQKYFGDYVDCGRTLGRGNLFIYTLPTSALGEIAIALELTGPCLFVQDDTVPLSSLVTHAQHVVADGEADQMLALWSDTQAVLCMVVDGLEGNDPIFAELSKSETSPLQLAGRFQLMVQQS